MLLVCKVMFWSTQVLVLYSLLPYYIVLINIQSYCVYMYIYIHTVEIIYTLYTYTSYQSTSRHDDILLHHINHSVHSAFDCLDPSWVSKRSSGRNRSCRDVPQAANLTGRSHGICWSVVAIEPYDRMLER